MVHNSFLKQWQLTALCEFNLAAQKEQTARHKHTAEKFKLFFKTQES